MKKSAKILVTGGSGFIGKNLIKKLNELDYNDITSISRSLSKNNIVFDLTHDLSSNDILSKQSYELIIHLAGFKFVDRSEIEILESIRNNIIASNNLFKYSTNSNVEKLLVISSDKATNIKSVYGATKFLVEKLSNYYNKNSKTTFINLRLPNILFSPGSITSKWKTSIINNQEVFVTNLECSRFFIDIDTAVSLILSSTGIKNVENKLMKGVSLKVLLEAFINIYNPNFDKDLIKI
ncbi:MAG: polysaccharide biosynthesis protein, partial [Flavobacteriaceae bacterium]|nr:polysaccharide biosynthesis protein [Flavobacteriaceae bacterium]